MSSCACQFAARAVALLNVFVVVGGLVIRLELSGFERLLVGRRHHRPDARVAKQIPADEVRVAAVVRVAEHALARVVRAPARKTAPSCRRKCPAWPCPDLDVHQHRVLVRRSISSRKPLPRDASRVAIERRQAGGIRLTRRAERAAERAIDVVRGPCFPRARSERIAGNQPIDDRFEQVGFGRGQIFEGFTRSRRPCGCRRLRGFRGAGGVRRRQQRHWSGCRSSSCDANTSQQVAPRDDV